MSRRIRSLILLTLLGLLPSTLGASPDEELGRALERGVEFLLESQNDDGSWGSPHRTKGLNIYAPVPGAHHAFRAGTSGLCIAALAELHDLEGLSDRIERSLRRAEAWLLEELPRLRRATPTAIYNIWGHAYSIRALCRLVELRSDEPRRVERFRELIAGQIERLERYETVNGGWGYYDFDFGTQKPAGSPTSFTTATVLIALSEARDLGFEISPRLVERARISIHRQRKPDFSYIYGEYLRSRPMRLVNRHGGSLGRTQVCNLALDLWSDPAVTPEVQERCLKRLLDRDLWLDIGRKRPIPHESWFQVAGYFYYYGFFYGASTIERLSPGARPVLARRLAKTLVDLQEKDGSWWDYPLYSYHQPYGTGYALLSLVHCREALRAETPRS